MEAMNVSMQGRVVRQRTLIVAVVVAALVGVAAGLLLAPDAGSSPGLDEGNVAQDPGPRGMSNRVPVGYARTEEGAVVAATNFSLVSTSELVRDRDALVRAVETLAAPSWRDEARRQAENGHDFAVDHYGEDVQMTTSVLRYQVLSFSRDAATVQLWAVTVARGSNRPDIEAIWGTSTQELEWIAGDWRVRHGDSEEGPVPVAIQDASDVAAFNNLLGDFRDFTEGPRP